MELRYQSIITDLLRKPWPERIRLLRIFNVKYIVSSRELDKNPELTDDVVKVNEYVYRLKDYLPRAWIVSHVVPFRKGTPEELAEPSFDPYHMVLSKGPVPSTSIGSYYQPVPSLRYEGGGRIHMEVSARKKGFLVLSESSYPGWRVFVDGKEKECLWLNLLFQGVEIDSGKHDVDFVFRPEGFAVFVMISAVSLFLFFAGFAVFALRKNKCLPFRKG
jgi:Bacterial membrane protein YfhO